MQNPCFERKDIPTYMKNSRSKRGYDARLRYIVSIAVFSALAYVVSVLTGFIKVQFLTFDAKDCIITIGALSLGPVAGAVTAAIVALLEFLLSSTTGVYGLIMNFISSATFALSASLVYRFRRSFRAAIVGLSASVVLTTAVMMLANYLITPFYMGVPRSAVVGMIPTLLLPFNLIKALLNAALTLLLYKHVTHALVRARLIEKRCVGHTASKNAKPPASTPAKRACKPFPLRTVVASVVAALLLVAGILIYFLVLDARLTPFWR